MKHGRETPFERRKEKDRYYYVGKCGNCGREYKLGAPRWLPDDVVVDKLYQKGMVGEGYLSKGMPRYLYCKECSPADESKKEGVGAMENVLFSNLPVKAWMRVRQMQQNPGYVSLRFALPPELGTVIRQNDLQLVARFVRVGSGYVRIKLKPAEKGDIKRGGPQKTLDGDATRWYSVRLSLSASRPVVIISQSLVEALIDRPLGSFAGNLDIELERYSPHNYKEGAQYAFAYDCPTLGFRIGQEEEAEPASTGAVEEEEEQGGGEEEETPVTGAVPEESIPEGVGTYYETPDLAEETPTPAVDVKEFSVDQSMEVIHRDLENVNLHLMNLQDKGWQPEISVEDNHIRVRVSKVLS